MISRGNKGKVHDHVTSSHSGVRPNSTLASGSRIGWVQTTTNNVRQKARLVPHVTYTRPGYPGRVDPPGYPGGSPCVMRGTVIRPSRHLTPNQDILGGWTHRDIQGGHLTPNQDILEGWTHLDIQGGHLVRREGRSLALRVTTPNQDILEGWTHLGIQGGHLVRCEGR